MKKLITILFICLLQTSFATTYYVSNSGSDANTGISASTAWQTLSKVNATSFNPGDNILFKRGDTFYGQLENILTGSASDSLVFSAYGTGDKPIITGFTSVSNWTNLGNNIWESTNAVSTLNKLELVLINGINTPIGRWPNADNTYPFLPNFNTFQSHSGKTSLTSSSLSGSNWAGGEVVVRQNQWTLNKASITSQSGNTITYSPLYDEPVDGWGFYIQNHPNTLDNQNEWYYNPSNKKIQVYSVSEPVNVQVATIDTLFSNSNEGYPQNSYVSIKNISFVGADMVAISLNGTGRSTISNCNVSFTGEFGIELSGMSNFAVIGNTITDCGTTAINHSNGSNLTLLSNTIKRAGLVSTILYNDYDGVTIEFFADNSLVQYNNIDSSGHGGIAFRGNNIQVLNNFVNHSNIHRGDAGGIYTGHAGETGKIIDGNIVLNSIGNGRGTPDNGHAGHGIYLDDLANDVTVTNNTMANNSASGLFLHNSYNNRVHNNTVYNNNGNVGEEWYNSQLFNQSDGGIYQGKTRGNTVTRNIFFAKTAAQTALKYFAQDSTNLVQDFGVLDSNYYAKPIQPSTAMKSFQNSSNITTLSLAGWKTLSQQDAHSLEAPRMINSPDSLRFEYNATNTATTISLLPYKYIDVKNNIYDGSITLQPWSSAVLIQDGPATDCCAGIEENEATPSISIFPNPVNDNFTVEGATQISSIKVVDLSGRTMKTFKPTSSNVYSISGLASGTYLVVITNGSSEVSKHIVKQ